MRIALTGSSSVGKTTLLESLAQRPAFVAQAPVVLSTDARALLRQLGHHSMDAMTQDDTRAFQLEYYRRKLIQEAAISDFVTDRSFVDVAAYWLERDTVGCTPAVREQLLPPCREQSAKYTLHIYLPFGLVPFEKDGYRSENIDLHKAVDRRIAELLRSWELRVLTLDTSDHARRVELVLAALGCE